MRYFLRFAYDGTAFHGSQRQPNGVTVQETMEQALALIFREEVQLTFAGRTDAGVHAREMYAHFDIGDEAMKKERETRIPPQRNFTRFQRYFRHLSRQRKCTCSLRCSTSNI